MKLSPVYEEYRLFRCSDCDPEHWDAEERAEREEEGLPLYENAYEVVLPIDGELVKSDRADVSAPVNTCPRCDSHLSLCADVSVRLVRS